VTTIYKVRAQRDLHPTDPLHVGNFYPNVQRFHRKKMQDRQDLILYLAQLHATAITHCAWLVGHAPSVRCRFG
jgi:tryptophanyl-tRNA synthetase